MLFCLTWNGSSDFGRFQKVTPTHGFFSAIKVQSVSDFWFNGVSLRLPLRKCPPVNLFLFFGGSSFCVVTPEVFAGASKIEFLFTTTVEAFMQGHLRAFDLLSHSHIYTVRRHGGPYPGRAYTVIMAVLI